MNPSVAGYIPLMCPAATSVLDNYPFLNGMWLNRIFHVDLGQYALTPFATTLTA